MAEMDSLQSSSGANGKTSSSGEPSGGGSRRVYVRKANPRLGVATPPHLRFRLRALHAMRANRRHRRQVPCPRHAVKFQTSSSGSGRQQQHWKRRCSGRRRWERRTMRRWRRPKGSESPLQQSPLHLRRASYARRGRAAAVNKSFVRRERPHRALGKRESPIPRPLEASRARNGLLNPAGLKGARYTRFGRRRRQRRRRRKSLHRRTRWLPR